jgi:cytochrome c5
MLILTALGLIVGLALLGCAGTANGNNGEETNEVDEEIVEEALEGATGEAVGEATEEVIDAAALIDDRCTMCHTADRIESEKGDAEDWEEIVDEMVGKGAKLDDEERAALITYLTE